MKIDIFEQNANSNVIDLHLMYRRSAVTIFTITIANDGS